MLRAGTRLKSQADSTELLVVRAPGKSVAVHCGGRPMVEQTPSGATDSVADGAESGNFGLRLQTVDQQLEVLVIKGGSGELTVDASPLVAVSPATGNSHERSGA